MVRAVAVQKVLSAGAVSSLSTAITEVKIHAKSLRCSTLYARHQANLRRSFFRSRRPLRPAHALSPRVSPSATGFWQRRGKGHFVGLGQCADLR